MQISSINPSIQNKNIKRPKKINFKNHPDFVRLQKRYAVTASNYFRRGPCYGTESKDFKDIINVFNNIFSKDLLKPVKMLIVGIADSQEPFSFLAVIKDIIKSKKLNNVLDLSIVDLQSMPDDKKLFADSFYEGYQEPTFAPGSFVFDYNEKNGKYFLPRNYRVDDEIFEFLKSTYSNPLKSKWETRIQDAIVLYKEPFDVISINNTLGYILDGEREETVRNIDKVLDKSSILITDPHFTHLKDARIEKNYEYVHDGIFRKIK